MASASRRRAALAALLLCWLALWFAGAQSRALLEPDEGRYAEVPREMVASGDWVTPRYDGVLFFDKPALQYWGTALAYEAFGASNWTARLWGLLTGLMAMLAVGWAGARAFGRLAGFSAALVLGSSLLWVVGSHLNTLDLGVSAFLALALSAFIVAQLPETVPRARRGWMLLTWMAMAAAVLSKGLIGVVFPAGALFFYMLWTRQWHLLKRMEWRWGLLLLFGLTVPWFVAVSLRHPQFFDYFFIREHFTRFLTDRDDRQRPFWFFLPVLVVGVFPWLLLLPAALKRPQSRQGFDARKLLWIWTLMIFVFFSISHSKLPLYLLPVFPAVALLTGDAIARMRPARIALALAGAAGLLVAGVFVALHRKVPVELSMVASAFHGYMEQIAWAQALAALALCGAALLVWRGRTYAGVMLAAFSGLGLMQAALLGFQMLAPAYSAQPLAQAMRPWLRADTPVYMVDTLQRGLPFYLRRTVTLVGAVPYDLRDGLRIQPGLLHRLSGFEDAWRDQPGALAVMAPSTYAALRAKGLPMQLLERAPGWLLVRRASGPGVADNPGFPDDTVRTACLHDSRSAVPPSTATACSPAPPSPRAATSSTTRDS